ncbi:MAG: MFS transporter, partial [Deltaproteobacteria bacterium]|nr:MFS transporter [Deltaproteobacteria bacterium]
PLAVNGIFGNMGVACAALIAGFLIDHAGWRSAFVWPGVLSVVTGIAYVLFLRGKAGTGELEQGKTGAGRRGEKPLLTGRMLLHVFVIIYVSTAIGGFLFQSTTFALPKVFDEKLAGLAISATLVGWYAFLVFGFAAFGQLIVGYLVDRYSVRVVFSLVAALQALFLASCPDSRAGPPSWFPWHSCWRYSARYPSTMC